MKPLVAKCLLLGACMGILGIPANVALTQDAGLSAKAQRQLNELIDVYQNQSPRKFVLLSREILNRSGKSVLEKINLELQNRKLPSIQEMVAQVRIDATKSKLTLPEPSWNEFQGIVPQLVKQINTLIATFEKHPLSGAEVTAPDKFSQYEDWIWDLHVFRNQFNILDEVAKQTHIAKRKFTRQIEKHRANVDGETIESFDVDLSKLAAKMQQMVQDIDEREAEIRVLRIDDASSIVAEGKQFADQFDAAFALAFDQLFFREFFGQAEREKRKFKNPDLNDPSISGIVSELVESAQTKNPSLFEKAKLFYVASHWWLRGRYGQGPLANGLLKSELAAKDESARFPLFMPVEMPNIDQLIGEQPTRPVVRRHEFVWSLGNEGIESQSMRGPKTPVVATLDRFY